MAAPCEPTTSAQSQNYGLQQSTPLQPQISSTLSVDFPQNNIEILNLKNNLAAESLLIKIVEIKNCPTTLDAAKLLSNSVFRSIIEPLSNLTILKLKIDEKLIELHAEKPKIHEFDKIKRNFLITFESTKDESQKIIYWKNGEAEQFATVMLTEGFSANLTEFVVEFLIEIVHISSFIQNNLELIDLYDANGFNLLMFSADKIENLHIIDELLKLPFDINEKNKEGQTAADIAWKNENSETLLRLLQANSMYPSNFDSNKASDEIKAFLEISNEMHQAVWSTQVNDSNEYDLTKVTELIQKNPNLRFFYNSENETAAIASINAQNLKLYDFLTKNGCSPGIHENIADKLNALNFDEPQKKKFKLDVTATHDQVAKDLPEKHLSVHYANTVIAHDDQLTQLRFKSVKEAFNVLSKIPLTKKILQVTAKHKNFKTHFDFNRTSVEFMNLTSGPETRGIFYLSGKIKVAAKELLSDDKSTKFAAIGTLAHEFCHFAMDLTFCNHCKPYAIDDAVNQARFSEIIKNMKENFADKWLKKLTDQSIDHIRQCEELKDFDKIIFLVFDCYDEALWPSELIVRVPQMTAHYHNDQDKLTQLKATFKELFDYYDEIFEPKIDESMKMIQKLHDNSTQITFDDLTDAYKAKIHHSIVEFQGKNVKFSQIIEEKNSEIYKTLNSEYIRGILIEDNILVIGETPDIKDDFYFERKFLDYDLVTGSDGVRNSLINFDQIIDEANETKIILLSDHAGAGKSTTFRHFSIKLKEKFPNFCVYFVDLKRHLKVYKKNLNKNAEKYEILSILLEILQISDELHVKIFTKLFSDDKVILLLDGVDEIAPKFKEFVIKFIKNLRSLTKIQQWIATRPQHMNEIREIFQINAYKLESLSNSETQKKFIKEVLKQNHVESEKEIKKNLENLTDNQFFQLNNINSPQLIKMIVELYLQNGKIAENFNLYSLYEQIIEKKIQIVAKEKGEIVNDDCINRNTKLKLTIWQIHQIYALKLFHSAGVENNLGLSQINLNEFSLIKRWTMTEKLKWTPEQISRYGFLIVDNWNTDFDFPDFSHRTFAEFFATQYLIEDLYELDEDDDSMSQEEIKIRIRFLVEFKFSTKFMESFIESHSRKKFNEQLFEIITSDEVSKYIGERLREDGMPTLINFFGIDERFLKKFRYKNETILQTIFKNQFNVGWKWLTLFKKMIKIYENSLGREWMRHTGYSFTGDLLSNDEEMNKISDEDDRAIYQLLYFINQADIPPEYINEFICCYLFNIIDLMLEYDSLFEEKFFEIVATKFHKCKNEFEEIFEGCDSHESVRVLPKINHDNVALKINEIFERLKLFLYPDDGRNVTQAFRTARIHTFVRHFKLNQLIDIYCEEFNYFTRKELQDYFIENPFYVFEKSKRENSSLEFCFNKIFFENQDKDFANAQVRNFLINRHKGIGHAGINIYNVHSAISCDQSEIETESKTESAEMLVANHKYLCNLARKVELSADEINNLSECLKNEARNFDDLLFRRQRSERCVPSDLIRKDIFSLDS